MTWDAIVTSIVAFLCTYLVHSTLILAPVWWLVVKCRWPIDPRLRSQLLKLSLVAPLGATLALTVCGGLHWGLQIPLGRQGAQAVWSDEATNDSGARLDSNPYAALPVLGNPASKSAPEIIGASVRNRAGSASDATSLEAAIARQSAEPNAVFDGRRVWLAAIVSFWITFATAGLLRLAIQWLGLRHIRESAAAIVDARLLEEKERLRAQFGIRRQVALLASSRTTSPLAAGIVRPFILLPKHPGAGDGSSAMLAHELAHIASHDASWNLLLQVICRVFFFQPFNWFISNAIRQEMDFKADSMAVDILGERLSLVQCLYSTGMQLNGHRTSASPAFVLASGMALFQSTLGQRIEAILNTEPNAKQPGALTRATLLLVTLLCTFSIALLAPRAIGETVPSSSPHSTDRKTMMNRTMASLLVLAGLSMPATGDEPETPAASAQTEPAALKTTPDKLPEGIRRFNGMLVGRIAAKDVEQGTFTVLVDAVPRVWENSRAEDPQSIVGKTIDVSGVFGKFLDVLVVTRVGDTLEFECKHSWHRPRPTQSNDEAIDAPMSLS